MSGGRGDGQSTHFSEARRQQLGHRLGWYTEQIRCFSVGVPTEDAQRQARALKPGELAEPQHGRRQVRRSAGRLAGELLAASVHIASQGTSNVFGRHPLGRTGEVDHPQRHGPRGCRFVTDKCERERVEGIAVAVQEGLMLQTGIQTVGPASGICA